MSRSLASELPAELLERIFNASSRPSGLVLSLRDLMCCQLVCKSWLHALVTGRLTVEQLYLAAGAPEDVPRRALWVQHMRPAVCDLEIDLGWQSPKEVLDSWDSHENNVPALEAVLGAVDALQRPSILYSVDLTAPFWALYEIVLHLSRFTGLRQLRLVAQAEETGDSDDEWDQDAEVCPLLLQNLPLQLKCLTLVKFNRVQLACAAEGEAAGVDGSGGAAQPQPLAALRQLYLEDVNVAEFNLPLPRLSVLSFDMVMSVSLAGPALHLPRVPELSIFWAIKGVQLRCAALPALAQLFTDSRVTASDSFSALRSLTQVVLRWEHRIEHEHAALLSGVSASLRRLCMHLVSHLNQNMAQQAAQMAADAHLTQLTRLDFTSTVCIGHLPSWPALEELFLWCMPPTAIQPEHVALLAAATRLRRLALDVSDLPRGAEAEEQGRIQELQLALPHCRVHGFKEEDEIPGP